MPSYRFSVPGADFEGGVVAFPLTSVDSSFFFPSFFGALGLLAKDLACRIASLDDKDKDVWFDVRRLDRDADCREVLESLAITLDCRRIALMLGWSCAGYCPQSCDILTKGNDEVAVLS